MRIAGVRRAAVLIGAAGIGVLGFAGAAFAHVTVSPSSAAQGSEAVVTFRVPTESPTASTTKVDLNFPYQTEPIAVVNVEQVPGWTAVVKQAKLTTPLKDDDGNEVTSAVSEIIWTADSPQSAIQRGQFQQFPIQLGPLPTNTSSIAFKVLQTYSNGNVVRWIEAPVAGQPEPDNPTPILTLTPASGSNASTPATAATNTTAAGSTSKPNNTWGIVGSLLGLIGAILGGAAYARTRNQVTDAGASADKS
ncbi:MAG TPA: YcnI family protein [Micromonosporaceae bacterium]